MSATPFKRSHRGISILYKMILMKNLTLFFVSIFFFVNLQSQPMVDNSLVIGPPISLMLGQVFR